MEPVRKLLHIPAKPCGQRAVLVVVVHGGQVAPGIVAAGKLDDAGFKVDAEPFPAKQKQAEARRRMGRAKTGPQAGRRKEERDEAGFQQHAVRLKAGEILRGGNERKKTHQAYRQATCAATG